jgi:predicted  nucleic acid-binding Zn-ribbon protein
MADDGDEGYVCTECGRQHPTDMSTCECGSVSFRPVNQRLTRECTECGTLVAKGVNACPECGFRSFEPLDAGPTAGEVATGYMEWQCTECGRSHQRNNPPCKRCGSHSFERVDVDADEVVPTEFVDGRWYEPDRTTIGLGLVAVLLVGVVGAGLLGFGPLAPDSPWTATVDTAALEPAVADELDAARAEDGAAPLEQDDALASAASGRAADLLSGDGGQTVAERVTACDATATAVGFSADRGSPGGRGDPTTDEVAQAAVSSVLSGESADAFRDPGTERVGVGAAAADGRLVVVVGVC